MHKNTTTYTHIFNITDREQEVMNLILKGFLTEKEIAERLIISTTTAKTHFNNIFQKLKVHSKTELVSFLYEEKLKSIKVYIASLKNKNKELMSKNEELKEHCKKIEETNKILYDEKCDLLKENEELRKSLSHSLLFKFQSQDKELKKYQKCLVEIKARVLNENADELLEWIIDKINEVEENV